MRKIIWFSRVSLFVIYFWFGILKIIGTSAAEPIVHKLFDITLIRLMEFQTFYFWFGIFECLIALIWLIPKLTFVAHNTTIFHVLLTSIPIFALQNVIWSNFYTPTLLGQYIIKNLLLLSCVFLLTHLHRIEIAVKERK